jgi:hypothetical protein
MDRASVLVLGGLFCSLVLMIQTSLAQNNSEKLPSFPHCNSRSSLRCLRLEHQKSFSCFQNRPADQSGVRARMVGQLDSLPSRIVQPNLKNTIPWRLPLNDLLSTASRRENFCVKNYASDGTGTFSKLLPQSPSPV